MIKIRKQYKEMMTQHIVTLSEPFDGATLPYLVHFSISDFKFRNNTNVYYSPKLKMI